MNRARCALVPLAVMLCVACGDDSGPGNENQNENESNPVCGNGRVEDGEQCDDGVANSDTVPDACRPTCRRAYCGDGVVDTGEACETGLLGGETCAGRGFTKGELSCDSTCAYDDSGCSLCGDGVAEGGAGDPGYEECDGDDLRNQECQDIGRPLGQLRCASDCTWDPFYCTGILPPDITSINGTGSASALAPRPADQTEFTTVFNGLAPNERHLAGNRIHGVDRELVIEGSNLSHIQTVTATGRNGQGTIVFEVSGGSDTMLRIRFPATVTVAAAGLFALTIVTNHGIAEADVFFLQGEKGDKGDLGDTGSCTCDQTTVAGVLASTQDFIDDVATVAVDMSVPAGTVVAYTGDISTAVPDGWLLCDGLEVSRTTFSDLFAAIGVSHGIGDGTTSFNLPDYRGRFLRGVDMGEGRDPDASGRAASGLTGNTGDAVGTLQHDATARPNSSFSTNDAGNHYHGLNAGYGHFQPNSGGLLVWWFNASAAAIARNSAYSGSHHHSITGGGDHETRPENVYVYYLIKH